MIPIIILAIENDSDREFMERLYIDYERLMYSEIMKLVKDTFVCEDVLQTTLAKLIDRLEHIRNLERKNLINYIITACRNNATSYLRKNKEKKHFHMILIQKMLIMPAMKYR